MSTHNEAELEQTEVKDYSFTLQIQGRDFEDNAVIDALYDAGCIDATPSIRLGCQYLDFDREGESFVSAALLSAISNVGSVPGLTVNRVDAEDLVTMSEIPEDPSLKGERSPTHCRPPRSRRLSTAGHALQLSKCTLELEASQWLAKHGYAIRTTDEDMASIDAVNGTLQLRRTLPALDTRPRDELTKWLLDRVLQSVTEPANYPRMQPDVKSVA